ncbi:LysR family transcriptional regulator, partial [Rhizobium johnstonii]
MFPAASAPDGPECEDSFRLAYFAAVVDTGSFTKAAERLAITKTVVSKQVERLEAELKT